MMQSAGEPHRIDPADWRSLNRKDFDTRVAQFRSINHQRRASVTV